jgi:hypothetical protein
LFNKREFYFVSYLFCLHIIPIPKPKKLPICRLFLYTYIKSPIHLLPSLSLLLAFYSSVRYVIFFLLLAHWYTLNVFIPINFMTFLNNNDNNLCFWFQIIPQAICSRNGLAIGAYFAWLVRILMIICFPISCPVGKVYSTILLNLLHDNHLVNNIM